MDKYVKLIRGKRWGYKDFNIRHGETKKCPDDILQHGINRLEIVSKPRSYRKIIPSRSTKRTYIRKTKTEDEPVKEDADDSGENTGHTGTE